MPVTPKILAFDTATQACSAAVLNGGKIFERFDVAPQKHSDLILLMIDAVLKEAGTTLQELDAIAVGVGPGSFMGVRLAVSIAQSLAFAQGKKIIPVSTLQILAQSAYRELNSLTKKIKNLLVGWDARMHEIYFGIYQLENNLMKPVQKDQMISPENFKLSKEIDSIAGNAWQVYENEFSTEVKKFLKEKNSLQAVIYASQINLQEIAPIDPSILACRRGGKERATGVYTQYMTVANDEGEAEFHVKHRFTPLSAKLKESLAGGLAPQEAEAYQHKAERQKTTGIYPQAKDLILIAQEKFEKQEYVNAENLEPVYLRNDVAKAG